MSTIDKMFQALAESSSTNLPTNRINEAKKQLVGRIEFKYECKVAYEGHLEKNLSASDVAKVDILQRVPQSSGASLGITSYPLAYEVLGPVLKQTRATPQMYFECELDGNDLEITLGIKMQGKNPDTKPSKPLKSIAKQLSKDLSEITVTDIENYFTEALKSSLKANLSKVPIYVGESEKGELVASLNSNTSHRDNRVYGYYGDGEFVGTVNLVCKSVNVVPNNMNEELLTSYKQFNN